MKIISLNTWGGRIHEPFLNFLKENEEVDIFCFQEVYKDAFGIEKEYLEDSLDLYNDISKMLPNHKGYFRPSIGDHYGLAIFVKSSIHVLEEGDVTIYDVQNYEGGGNHSRNLQYIKIQDKDKVLCVANVHGLWNGQGKTDTNERVEQSKRIVNFLQGINEDIVLCGDFNLLPETQSISIVEDFGLRNLIKDFNIISTRTSLYEKPVKFADYVFISQKIKVNDFKVMIDEVSDHSPLWLEIE